MPPPPAGAGGLPDLVERETRFELATFCLGTRPSRCVARLCPSAEAAPSDWLGAVPDPADWTSRYAITEAVYALGEREGMSVVVAAVETRVLVARLLPGIQRTGFPPPDVDVKGGAFSAAFDAWLVSLAGAIAPSARVGRS